MSDNSNETGNQIADTLKELLTVHKDILKTLEQIRDKPIPSNSRNPPPIDKR